MKVNDILKQIIIFVFLTAIYQLLTTAVFAQQVTLSMSPPIVETLIKPGKTVLIGYTVQNLGDPTPLLFKIRSFSPQGDYGEMIIDQELSGPIRFSLDNTDMELEQPFLMRSRDIRQALIRIRIPEGTPEGDYYYTILAESQPAPDIGGQSSPRATASIGSNLLITVTGTGITEANGRIALFDIPPLYKLTFGTTQYNLIESQSVVPVTLVIQNKGKNMVKPQGAITLRGPLSPTKSFPLIPQNILAESQRLVRTEGTLQSNDRVSLKLSGFLLGTYSLSASVYFGEGSQQLFANAAFIALPFRLMGVLSLLLFITLGLIYFAKKKRE